MPDSLRFSFSLKHENIVLVKKLDIGTEKKFLSNRMRTRNKQNTERISDYLQVTHAGSQTLNRDVIFDYTSECLFKVLKRTEYRRQCTKNI